MPAAEHAHQVAVCQWLTAQGVPHFAVPNAGKRSYRLARYLKAEGMMAGAPDLVIIRSPPIALEMKTETGRLSPAQLEAHDAMRKAGWVVLVGKGAKDAVDQLRRVL